MSGTPANFQRKLSTKHKENRCECPPKTAIENKYIMKPVINMVQCSYKDAFKGVVVAVLHREIDICSGKTARNDGKFEDGTFRVRILANFNSIDDIYQFTSDKYVKDNIGKKFHVIAIHSDKTFIDTNGCEGEAFSMVDGKKEKDVYARIENLNTETAFEDDLPVIVCQVAMIGEGMNVKCFNSCITSTNSDKTAMQQFGRTMRICEVNGKSKLDYGHANIYVVAENVEKMKALLVNLHTYDLDSDCFDWGSILIDPLKGSGDDGSSSNAVSRLVKQQWEKIDPTKNIDIICLQSEVDEKIYKNMAHEFVATYMKSVPQDVLARLLASIPDVRMSATEASQKVKVLKEACKQGKVAKKDMTAKQKAQKKEKQDMTTNLFQWISSLKNVVNDGYVMKAMWNDGDLGVETVIAQATQNIEFAKALTEAFKDAVELKNMIGK